MWQISELKRRAHDGMGTAYWRSVLVSLVLVLITSGIASVAALGIVVAALGYVGGFAGFMPYYDFGMDSYGGNGYGGYGFGGNIPGADSGMEARPFGLKVSFDMGIPEFEPELFLHPLWILLGAVLLLLIIGCCIELFVLTPIHIGCRRFYIVNHAMPGRTKSSEMFHIFSHHYLHAIGVMVLRTIYLIVWTLILPAIAVTAVNVLNWYDPTLNLFVPVWVEVLLMFPGIIKSYSYMLVPYILAEEPGMPAGEVLALSIDMMKHNKLHAFGLQLSFLGWNILNVLTLGILGILYVFPYRETTMAEMYAAIRDEYLATHTYAD